MKNVREMDERQGGKGKEDENEKLHILRERERNVPFHFVGENSLRNFLLEFTICSDSFSYMYYIIVHAQLIYSRL